MALKKYENEGQGSEQKKEKFGDRLCSLILRMLKEQKITLRTAASQLREPVSPSQLHQILHGKSPLSVDRVVDLARILQTTTTDLMRQAEGSREESFETLSREQSDFLTDEMIRYKIAYAVIHAQRPVSTSFVTELFPESESRVPKILEDLVEMQILRKTKEGEYLNVSNHLPRLRFGPVTNDFVAKISKELHENAIRIPQTNSQFSRYVLTKLHHAYLTPEQMVHVRNTLMQLQEYIWSLQKHNVQNKDLQKLSQYHLMSLLTVLAPMNASSFVQRTYY